MFFTSLRIAMILVSLLAASTARADMFVLPRGAGFKDGSNWQNALDASTGGLQKGWDTLAAGETCWVGSGEYAGVSLQIKAGGSEGQYKKLIGIDRGAGLPLFIGDWTKDKPAKGRNFIEVARGVNSWWIQDLRVRHYRIGLAGAGRHNTAHIENFDVDNARSGIELSGGATAENLAIGTHDVVIEDCDFKNYTKRGLRVQGGVYNLQVRRCTADAGGREWAVEPFQMGFNVMGGENGVKDHDISFEACVASRNYNDAGDQYWNADGFVAERNAYNLRYLNCRAFDNTDGGWDDKSLNPALIGCIALRNKRNFRFWTTGTATLFNCVGAYAFKPGGTGSADGLWTPGKVRAEFCTFHGNPVGIELDGAKAEVELVNCIVSSDAVGQTSKVEDGSQLKSLGSILWQPGAAGLDPQFESAARAQWNGSGSALNSKKYGLAKGYHSGR